MGILYAGLNTVHRLSCAFYYRWNDCTKLQIRLMYFVVIYVRQNLGNDDVSNSISRSKLKSKLPFTDMVKIDFQASRPFTYFKLS